MMCPSCQTVLEDGARFCGGCGSRMDAPPPAAPAAPAQDLNATMISGPPPSMTVGAPGSPPPVLSGRMPLVQGASSAGAIPKTPGQPDDVPTVALRQAIAMQGSSIPPPSAGGKMPAYASAVRPAGAPPNVSAAATAQTLPGSLGQIPMPPAGVAPVAGPGGSQPGSPIGNAPPPTGHAAPKTGPASLPPRGASMPPGGGPHPLRSTGDPFIGQTLNGRYLIDSKIGEGGFGAVYRGRQVQAGQVGREVALKVLHPDMARDPNVLARFRREGQVACDLRDAHTITTYDFDQTPEGILYIAMELLRGRSLHEILHTEAPVAWHRVLSILEQMSTSLAEAHGKGIVHRDIKPENIYLEERPGAPDFVKILDFGIAKIVRGDGQTDPSMQLTATGQTLGTLEYMSPEQLMGKPLDGRSDIYAVGVLAYELLAGRLPFPEVSKGPAALIAAQLRKVPDPPSKARPDARIAPGADAIVLKMLEKDKTKRFVDANDMRLAVLEVLRAGGNVPAGLAAGPQGQGHQQQPVAGTPQPQQAQAHGAGGGHHVQMSASAAAPDSTHAALRAAGGGSKLWLWVVLAGIAIGGIVGGVIAFTR